MVEGDMEIKTEPTLRWGILGTARIALTKVVPGMQKSRMVEVVAVASRDLERAEAFAKRLRIPKAHGSYEALLEDPDVDVVYIPLPNHLHVEWAIAALEAGKHVLVEKPIGLTSDEGRRLVEVANAHPQLKAMEAFMYRFHPQWELARSIVADGGIGELSTVHSFFSYANLNPQDIRNQAAIGGGGLMDIGCYCISLSRLLFGSEPLRVVGTVDFAPEFGTDRLASAIMQFEKGTATFTCGTQIARHQGVQILGSDGRVEIDIPFNAPQDGPTHLRHQQGPVVGTTIETTFDRTDQYQLQGEALTKAILENQPVPWSLDDAVSNMVVIEAIFKSAERGGWVDVKL